MQLWRFSYRLASATSLAAMSKDFIVKDKWELIQTCLAKRIPITRAAFDRNP